ncbi:hypothetical protein [Vibrio breoganii]|uniref:hypothetical protein n=1 Tax=Vibrio breoganii TaxID=553239 RepID=UPI000C84CE48|nr:hypothetical protein [Vibrio breoganii]PMG90377.1 hypothetical protein BCU79_17935 [Vibrio breoganii]PMJ49453.1 hypothetical protein BCU21_18280 [Vibrio breoganii]PMK52798.1 hypothetical protein BCT97_16640 [Vibrio breoganii]PML28551.1 hypothetical protein BCT82_06745 [Vibrio breoganii]PMO25835.1 hypothetical protein BCT13_18385 [Vibrio breoganii]
MAKKLTKAQKKIRAQAKRERQAKYEMRMINGKQVRVKREATIDGMPVDEFLDRNADPLFWHNNEMWMCIDDESE